MKQTAAMRLSGHTWAVVLAAGDGTRLATLTTDSAGNAVPKQFCSLTGGKSLLQEDAGGLVLVGIEPDEPDPELGYILPGRALRGGACAVERFLEKPPAALANKLLAAGALWNSFIFAAPPCGWSDLGTPKRVADTLERLNLHGAKSVAPPGACARAPTPINLAAQHARLGVINGETAP